MTVRLCIVGAHGRMGKRLVELSGGDADLEVTGMVDSDTGGLDGVSADAVDCVIDFSVASQAGETARACAHKGWPLVIGTTGLSPGQRAALEGAAKKVPVLWAPNFSVGVNVLLDLVQRAARMLEGFDLEVVEAHHRHKVDAPSGTARALGEALAAGRGWKYDEVVTHGREGHVGARSDDEIGMSVVRGGDVVGEHSVLYLGTGEQVILEHKATSRDIFVLGALRAAKWLTREDRAPRMYGMADVLGVGA